ncbi:hypothetical protein CPB86DRAFT_741952 [Serendipita vermifera]|nr:hypothetical protein CPB86DRAFT_741952 [Serendipita vermifera]
MVAYHRGGFHIWDFSVLDEAKEALYLPTVEHVVAAAITSPHAITSATDRQVTLLLLLGPSDSTELMVHSLKEHSAIKRISVPNACRIEANAKFICVSVSTIESNAPAQGQAVTPGIHILSNSPKYEHLYTIPLHDTSIPSSAPVIALSSGRLLAYSSTLPSTPQEQQAQSTSYPPSNPLLHSSESSGIRSTASSALTAGLATVGSGMVTGALKIGSGMMEGVKMGIAAAGYGANSDRDMSNEAARMTSRSAPPTHPSPLYSRGHTRRASGQVRSAIPSAGSDPHHREGKKDAAGAGWITVVDLHTLLPPSTEHSAVDDETDGEHVPSVKSPSSSSFIATHATLTKLGASKSAKGPEIVVEFQYPSSANPLATVKRKPSPAPSAPDYSSPLSSPGLTSLHPNVFSKSENGISSLKWNDNGSMLAIGSAEGGSVKVIRILQPSPAQRRRDEASAKRGRDMNTTASRPKDPQLGYARVAVAYELMRGVTPSTIATIGWSQDGLWNAFVSGNRTVHLFAVNPTGGAPDEASHIQRKVLNSSTQHKNETWRLQASARLRKPYLPPTSSTDTDKDKSQDVSAHGSREDLSKQDGWDASLPYPAVTFVSEVASNSSRRLNISKETRPSGDHDTLAGASTPGAQKATSQDILVFDPVEGAVVLWRCSTGRPSTPVDGTESPTKKPMERATSVVGELPTPEATGGRWKTISALTKGGISGVARMAGVIRDGEVIAKWVLKRDESWPEVKQPLSLPAPAALKATLEENHLSHAEITTFHNRSSHVQRPIYLSHQFTFSALKGDYHALLRQFDFEPPSATLTVRKEAVLIRSGNEFVSPYGIDHGGNLPGEFDSEANFLGTNLGPMDLTDSPLLGGHLGLAPEGAPFSSSLASVSATSLSSHSLSSRRPMQHSFDDSITSAIETRLQLDASYSPSGSSSGVASPGRVIPMAPNGRPSSSGNGTIGAGLEAVMRGTTRVGKEVLGSLGHVRSPRLMPTKRTSTTGELLKFDEAEEMFMVDGFEVENASDDVSAPPGESAHQAIRTEGSSATIGPNVNEIRYPLMTDSGMTIVSPKAVRGAVGDEGTWVTQQEEYKQAIEEDNKFDDVTGILEEERAERQALQGSVTEITRTSTPAADSVRGTDSPKAKSKRKNKR